MSNSLITNALVLSAIAPAFVAALLLFKLAVLSRILIIAVAFLAAAIVFLIPIDLQFATLGLRPGPPQSMVNEYMIAAGLLLLVGVASIVSFRYPRIGLLLGLAVLLGGYLIRFETLAVNLTPSFVLVSLSSSLVGCLVIDAFALLRRKLALSSVLVWGMALPTCAIVSLFGLKVSIGELPVVAWTVESTEAFDEASRIDSERFELVGPGSRESLAVKDRRTGKISDPILSTKDAPLSNSSLKGTHIAVMIGRRRNEDVDEPYRYGIVRIDVYNAESRDSGSPPELHLARRHPAPDEPFLEVAPSSKSNWVAAAIPDGRVAIWNTNGAISYARTDRLRCCAHHWADEMSFSPDEKLLASWDSRCLVLWDLDTFLPVRCYHAWLLDFYDGNLGFSSDGNSIRAATIVAANTVLHLEWPVHSTYEWISVPAAFLAIVVLWSLAIGRLGFRRELPGNGVA